MKKQSDKNKKKKEQVSVRSSAAEYLNYVACVGNDEQQREIDKAIEEYNKRMENQLLV